MTGLVAMSIFFTVEGWVYVDSTLETVREFMIFPEKASPVSSLLWILQEGKKEADFPQTTELTVVVDLICYCLQNLILVPSPQSKVLHRPEGVHGWNWGTGGNN